MSSIFAIRRKYVKAKRVIQTAKNYQQFLVALNYCNNLINLPGHYLSHEAKILGDLMRKKRREILIEK